MSRNLGRGRPTVYDAGAPPVVGSGGEPADGVETRRGARVLQVLVQWERDGNVRATPIGDLVRQIEWAADGRSLAPVLRKLERAELVWPDHLPKMRRWRPTSRGREIDGILDRITAARGGRFQPMTGAGIDFYESSALT